MKRRPDFLVIGAQKSGTTSLCDLLANHPKIFMTTPKEPHYFSHDEVWGKGWQWYEQLYESADPQAVAGEGGTHNTMHYLFPNAPERIAANLPDAKLIYIVRHPIRRIESHWFYWFMGRQSKPFCKAVRENKEYIDNSQYWKQIGFYRENYPDSQILVVFFEDFNSNPLKVLNQCCDFLEVEAVSDLAGNSTIRNSSGNIIKDNALASALRKIRLLPFFFGMLPESVKQKARHFLKNGRNDLVQWDDETLAWALDKLAEDSRIFLEFYGKEKKYWDMS